MLNPTYLAINTRSIERRSQGFNQRTSRKLVYIPRKWKVRDNSLDRLRIPRRHPSMNQKENAYRKDKDERTDKQTKIQVEVSEDTIGRFAHSADRRIGGYNRCFPSFSR